MKKYSRTQINKNFMLHDIKFITVADMTEALVSLAQAAIEAGADEDELKVKVTQILKGDGDDKV